MRQFQDVATKGFMLTSANPPELSAFVPAARDLGAWIEDALGLGSGRGSGARDERVCTGRWDGLLPWQARRVRDYVDADLHTQVSLRAAACHARLSPGYFSRRFRRSFGVSFSRFVATRRVERAQILMLDKTDKLSQIALACGFADQSHFTRTFGNLTGCSPARWRRQTTIARRTA